MQTQSLKADFTSKGKKNKNKISNLKYALFIVNLIAVAQGFNKSIDVNNNRFIKRQKVFFKPLNSNPLSFENQ